MANKPVSLHWVVEIAPGRDAVLRLYDDQSISIEIGEFYDDPEEAGWDGQPMGYVYLPRRDLHMLRNPESGIWDKDRARHLVQVHCAVDKFVDEGDLLIG